MVAVGCNRPKLEEGN